MLKEIAYLGLGGGDRSCESPYTQPTIASDPDDTELMLETEMVTCGWKPGENLSFKVTYPNKKVVTGSGTASSIGKGVISYRPLLTDPEGIYQFTISGRGKAFTSNAYFRAPNIPRFYVLNARQLLFNNFKPGEKIRLFMYTCTKYFTDGSCSLFGFQGWQEYQMDSAGKKLLNAPAGEGYFFIRNAAGLELPPATSDAAKQGFEVSRTKSEASKNYRLSLEKKSQEYLACPQNTPSSRIVFSKPSATVSVAAPNGAGLDIFSNPRTTSRKVSRLPAGQTFELLKTNMIVCYEGKIWRRLTISSQTGSWTYYTTGYFIEMDEHQRTYIKQVNSR